MEEFKAELKSHKRNIRSVQDGDLYDIGYNAALEWVEMKVYE